MNESDSNVLTIQGLEKTYRDAVSGESLTIIKDLDMRVPAKSKIVILGESGCGKSTLLNIIGGLDSATGGFIQCGQYTISAMNEEHLTEFRSKYLGLIFQFHYLLKDFSALENVFLPPIWPVFQKAGYGKSFNTSAGCRFIPTPSSHSFTAFRR